MSVYITVERVEQIQPPTLLLPDPYRPSTFAEYRVETFELVPEPEQRPIGFSPEMRWKH